jgi:hypothetical protein
MSVSEGALVIANGARTDLSWDEACGLSREGLQIFLASVKCGELTEVEAEKFRDYNGMILKLLTVDNLHADFGLPKLRARTIYMSIRTLRIDAETALAAYSKNFENKIKEERKRKAAQASIDLVLKALQPIRDAGDAAENAGANTPKDDDWNDDWYGSCTCVCMFARIDQLLVQPRLVRQCL